MAKLSPTFLTYTWFYKSVSQSNTEGLHLRYGKKGKETVEMWFLKWASSLSEQMGGAHRRCWGTRPVFSLLWFLNSLPSFLLWSLLLYNPIWTEAVTFLTIQHLKHPAQFSTLSIIYRWSSTETKGRQDWGTGASWMPESLPEAEVLHWLPMSGVRRDLYCIYSKHLRYQADTGSRISWQKENTLAWPWAHAHSFLVIVL